MRRHLTDSSRDVAPRTDHFIEHFTRRTRGNFYVAVQKLGEIRRAPDAPSDSNTIPTSVADCHGETQDRLFRWCKEIDIPKDSAHTALREDAPRRVRPLHADRERRIRKRNHGTKQHLRGTNSPSAPASSSARHARPANQKGRVEPTIRVERTTCSLRDGDEGEENQ